LRRVDRQLLYFGLVQLSDHARQQLEAGLPKRSIRNTFPLATSPFTESCALRAVCCDPPPFRIATWSKRMTTTVEVKLDLPDELAKEVTRMGLLDPRTLQSVLRDAVRSRLVERLFGARKRIAASGLAPLTFEEVQTEIEADRTERRKPRR
jgi:hypothetical protein